MFYSKNKKKSVSGKLRFILNLATIGGVTLTSIKLGLSGIITAEHIAIILIVCAFVLAVKSPYVKIITFLLAVYVFAKTLGGNNSQAVEQVIISIMSLVFTVFCLYLIFKILFNR